MAAHCIEVAQPPVELVTTIGDGGMFVCADVDALLEATRALAQSVEHEGEQFPTMRAGIAFGPAVIRVGDWFGMTPPTRASPRNAQIREHGEHTAMIVVAHG
jgi:class 3 adenylate cyclase